MAEPDCVKKIADAGGIGRVEARRILRELHDTIEAREKEGATDPLKAATDELAARDKQRAEAAYLAKLHEAIGQVQPEGGELFQARQPDAEGNEELAYLLGDKSAVGVIGKERGDVKPNGISVLRHIGDPEGYQASRLVFAQGGKIVGAMQITKTPSGPATVANTYVAPEYRRQGIATVLNQRATSLFGPLERAEGPSAAGEAFRQSLGKELFQAPPFYSAVERAVTASKQEKASPQQWLATIRNTPGVKSEEMEWLGLEDWLKQQEGSVTRKEIGDYIRANAIEVKEVQRGAMGPRPTSREADAIVRWAHSAGVGPSRAKSAMDTVEAFEEGTQTARVTAEALEALGLPDDLLEPYRNYAGGETGPKFGQYTLPGGANYRELLLTLPRKEEGAGNIARYLSSFQRGLLDEIRSSEDLTQAKQFNAQLRETLKGVPDDQALAAITDAKAIQDEGPAFQTSHWDEPNVLAHIRFDDRTINGKKTLHIAEVQSDWHQKGRKQGYKTAEPHQFPAGTTVYQPDPTNHPNAWEFKLPGEGQIPSPRFWANSHDEATEVALRQYNEHAQGVPDAPFKTTWPELSLKRMIRYAAENGYEQISWDSGATNAERYDLSKHVKEIEYIKHPDGSYKLGIADKDGGNIRLPQETYKPEELSDLVGKEVADKIVNGEGKRYRGHEGTTLEGLDLKVGGDGMAGFYDQILPAAANKLGKKFGARVGEAEMGEKPNKQLRQDLIRQRQELGEGMSWTNNEAYDALTAQIDALEKAELGKNPNVHTLPITPELREAATSQGFPLFQRGSQLGSITLNPKGVPGRDMLGLPDVRPIIRLAASADASTFIHESGHQFLAELMRDAEHEAAPDALKADAKSVLDWLKIGNADDIKTRHHEKFARGFEQYMREGVAPSHELAGVFAQFRQWLLRIYQTLRGLGSEITPEIRGVFDRMLVAEPQRTVIAPERAVSPTMSDIHVVDAAHTEPAEAEPAADRIGAETQQFLSNIPPEIQNAHAAEIERITAKAAGPPGETGAGPVEPGQVVAGGGKPEPGTPGGPGGAAGGAELRGAGATLPEGARPPGAGERPGLTSQPDAGLGDQPLAPRPRPTVGGATESPFTDKAGNIRLENLTSEKDVADAIRASAEENNDFIGDRQGVVTDGQVDQLAEDLGMAGAEKLVKERVIGQAFNAVQVMALRKLLVQSATEVSAAMKRAGAGTDQDVIAYAIAKDRHQMIQATVAQATAEAGRALRAFRNISGMTGEAAQADMFVRQATGKTLFQLRAEAKLGSELTTPQQVSTYMRDVLNKNFGRLILEYWINGLISGPVTHMTYAIGNEILTLQKALPETAMAAAIGNLRKALGREGDTVRMGEVGAKLAAHGRSFAPAAQAFFDALRSGQTVMLPGEHAGQNILPFPGAMTLAQPALMNEAARFSDATASMFAMLRGIKEGMVAAGALADAAGTTPPSFGLMYSHLGAIPDVTLGRFTVPVGTAVRLPSRLVAAIHSVYRVTNYSMEKAGGAYRMAANEGHEGASLDQRIADISLNPTQQQMEAWGHNATETTLMGQAGALTRALSNLTNTPFFVKRDVNGKVIPGSGVPLLKFIDPFVHISSNIIQQSIIERTPVGVFSSEIRADLMGRNGNVAQDTAMARMLVGSLYAIGLGGLAASGYVSGSEPSDPRQAATWRLAGNQAHSVRIGDVWYDMHRLGPLGMLLGISADMYNVAHEASQGDMLLAASHLQHAITQNILDESFMRGPSDLIRAVEDPGRFGEGYLRNMVSSFVPYSVGMAQMARAADPYSRQARTVVDSIRAKVPGMSESLLPRRDIWGEPLPNKTALATSAVTAIYEQRISRDPVNQALLQLGIYPAQLVRKIRNVDLTDAQYDDFQRIAGRMTKQRLDVIVNSPDFGTWPNHVRHDVIQEVITQSREAARGMMMMKYPQIPQEATEAKLKRLQD